MRSKLLLVSSVLAVVSLLVACAPAAPQVVEKTVIQTVVVEKEVAVEKEVKVVVTATPVPAPAVRPKISFWMNYNFEEAVNIVVRDQVKTWAQLNNVDVDILIAKDADLHTKWSAGSHSSTRGGNSNICLG